MGKKISSDPFIDGKKLSLESFLEILFSKKSRWLNPNNHFPTDELLNQYLESIHTRSENEVKDLLRMFLIKNGTFGLDIFYRKHYIELLQERKSNNNNEKLPIIDTEYGRRLMAYKPPYNNVWEGLTWVLDLLPHFPNEAVRGIDAYFLANCQFLPDSYLSALSDCGIVLKAKYIETLHPKEVFQSFSHQEFEMLIAELYDKLGYATTLTKSSHDGGVDIYANKAKPGKKEKLIIQCKRYSNNIGVREVRELLGVLAHQKTMKCVLVSSSEFSPSAKRFADDDPRVELIGFNDLTLLLNKHLGPHWMLKTNRIILGQKTKLKSITP